jgi:tetratricopeptide (TPR) repeat protein
MERNHWREALAALDEAIRARPHNAECRLKRGEFFSAHGEHAKATADFAFELEGNPNDAQMHYRVAISMLVAGDLAGYRAACAAMLQRFGDSEESLVANRVAYSCVYGPDAVLDMQRLIRVAQAAVPSHQGGERILGGVLFRAGRYQEALKCFDQSHRAFKPRAWDWLLLAMIHGSLGHRDEARRIFSQADQWITQADAARQGNGGDPQSGWNNELERSAILVLRGEADVVVRFGAGFPADPFAHGTGHRPGELSEY